MPIRNKIKQQPVLLTVGGFLSAMLPAKNRPSCVLELHNGRDTGLYYVPLPPHECRLQFQEQTRISFRIYADTQPDTAGVIDTAGDAARLWDIETSNRQKKGR